MDELRASARLDSTPLAPCLSGWLAVVLIGICVAVGPSPTRAAEGAASPAPTGTPENSDTPENSTKPEDSSKPENSLDALLDKDLSALLSVSISDAPSLGSGQETVFDPNKSASGAGNSTGELLSQAPGVVIRSTSALNQDARIRGYFGSQVVGVANGENQGKTRLDIDSLFSQIDPNLIQEVTVIAGPYSVEYGPGFAFFDARLIAPERAAQATASSISNFGFNTNGQQFMWRETLGFADQHSGAILSFGQRMGSAYRPGAHSTDFNVPAGYHADDVYFALSRDQNDFMHWDFSYLHQSLSNTQLPGVAYDITTQHGDQFNVRWAMRDDSDTDRLQLQFWWNQAAYQGDASSTSKQETFFQTLIGQPYPGLTNLAANGLSDNWGARAMTLWGDSDNCQVKIGADWRRVRQFYRELDLDSGGANYFGSFIYGIPDSSADDFGLFANGAAKLNDSWIITVGQRFDSVIYNVSPLDPIVASPQSTPNGDFLPGLQTPTRNLSMTYLTSNCQLTDEVAVHAGIAYAMRPPNITELYSNAPFAPLVRFGNSYAYGDSTLAAEKNLQLDLGFKTHLEKFTFGANAYYATIHDYIGLAALDYSTFPVVGTVPPGTLDRGKPYFAYPPIGTQDISADSASLSYIYRNLDRVTLYGVNLLGEYQVQPWLELVGTLNFTEGINHNPTWVDIDTGQVNTLAAREGLPGIYPINSIVTLRFVEPDTRKWVVEWQCRFARHQRYLASSLGELGTPGFAVYNINASYRWTDHFSVKSSLLNVFDRNYYEHNSLAIVDRNGNIGFVKNPGISLFLGIEAQF